MKTWQKRGHETTIKDVVLRNLGLNDISELTDWFKKYFEHAWRLDRLQEMCDLIRAHKNKRITIVGDYDVDGQTSSSILYKALTQIGCSDVHIRIPKRFSEGFGINRTIVDEIPDGLILTCDNGIAMVEVIAYAKQKGLMVGIIDHHEANADGILPPADVCIDPMAIPGSADFDGYCGAGLCYKIACELLGYDQIACQRLLPLAAIGTVADVMPLREENYVIVRRGLQVIEKRNLLPIGLIALLSELKMAPKISAHDIGFKIGPCLNACSRMYDEGAKLGITLMTYEGAYENVLNLSRQLIALNNKRKTIQTSAVNDLLIKFKSEQMSCPIIVKFDDLPEGLAGPIAGSICEKFKMPTIVLTRSAYESGILKGSSRSCGNYHMKNELDKVKDLLTHHGGHAGAAGLSLKEENFEEFRNVMTENGAGFEYTEGDLLDFDLEIMATQLSDYTDDAEQYEPFGMGNPAPVFFIKDFVVTPRDGVYKSIIGPEANIVKLQSNIGTSAIGFGMAEAMRFINEPKKLNLIANINKNYYVGKNGTLYITPQAEFFDFENIEEARTPLGAILNAL